MYEAYEKQADIVHFAECALSGYAGVDRGPLHDFPWAQQSDELKKILALAKELRLWVVLGATHRLSGSHKPHNSLYVITPDGTIMDRYDKRFCTTSDLRYYSPGDHFVTFEVKGIRCGLLICYDVRFPELYRRYSSLGVQLMFHSFHNARLKETSILPGIIPLTVQAHASANYMFVSLSNSCVPHSWESRFVTPDGMEADALTRNEPGVMVSVVNVSQQYYDASHRFRRDAIMGKLNSGDVVVDPRSSDRTSP